MNEVLITAWQEKEGNTLNESKLIRINDNKPEYGSMMVSVQTREFSFGGFTNPRTRVAFIAGTVEDLEKMIKQHKLEAGTNFSKKFGEHKIVTVEKLESEVGPKSGFTTKMNPSTKEILTSGGETIMRRTYLVSATNEKVNDILIDHDKDEDAAAFDPAVEEFQAADTERTKSK